jgi:hypothetical protein
MFAAGLRSCCQGDQASLLDPVGDDLGDRWFALGERAGLVEDDRMQAMRLLELLERRGFDPK